VSNTPWHRHIADHPDLQIIPQVLAPIQQARPHQSLKDPQLPDVNALPLHSLCPMTAQSRQFGTHLAHRRVTPLHLEYRLACELDLPSSKLIDHHLQQIWSTHLISSRAILPLPEPGSRDPHPPLRLLRFIGVIPRMARLICLPLRT
jgi:hypothetical protein